MKIIPRNWADFQHYKDRSPPWIKLHKGLLDNYDYQLLPVASRALAPMLWLLASESEGGVIDATPHKLAFRLRMTEKEVSDSLKPLIESGFFELVQDASKPLSEYKRDACPEERRGETEVEAEESGVVTPQPPPVEKSKRKNKNEGLTLPEYLGQRKAADLPPFDADNTAEKYIAKIKLPPEFFALYWRTFREKHSEGGPSEKTRKLEWAAHLRNGIENNWYQLWFINGDGKFELTTKGKQAQIAQSRNAA